MLTKNLNKREKYAALLAGLLIFFAILYTLILEPIAKHWQTLHNQSKAKLHALTKDLRILASSSNLEIKYQKLSKYLKPEQNEAEAVAETLAYIESISRDDQCLVVNIKPVGTKELNACKEILIDINSEATASQYAKFLYDIENTRDMILKVRHFTFGAKSGQTGTLRGSFLISRTVIE